MSLTEDDTATAQVAGLRTLAEGRLYALQNPIPLDGRVGLYPADIRGHSVTNCYLLKEGRDLLLLDTGFAVHEGAILSQLAPLIAPGDTLSVYPLRLNEYSSIGNAEAISLQHPVARYYASTPNIALWVDLGDHPVQAAAREAVPPTTVVSREYLIELGDGGARPVDTFHAPIRLLGTRWIYDAATKTLFTSDSFTHEIAQTPEGPWQIGRDALRVDDAGLRRHLLNARYWWLEGAETASLRARVAEVAASRQIDRIAPGYGAIIEGADAVAAAFAQFDRVLADLDRANRPSLYAPRNVLR